MIRDFTAKIGDCFSLKVHKKHLLKGKWNYLAIYEKSLVCVPFPSEKKDDPIPRSIDCMVKSFNEYGLPVFVLKPEIKSTNQIATLPDNQPRTSEADILKETSVSKIKRDELQKPVQKMRMTDFRWCGQKTNFIEWWVKTGGVEKRLHCLIDVAQALLNYHRANRVYKDFDPDMFNVVLTGDIIHVSLPETNYLVSGFNSIFVKDGYAAPEIANRISPNTPMSDCFAFAVLVHELLEFCHPFVGDRVREDNSKLHDAYGGRLPWIDDGDDGSNRLSNRPYDKPFTTTQIRHLFNQTFSCGQFNPLARPAMFEWVDALREELQTILYCPHCQTHYLISQGRRCVFCGADSREGILVEIAKQGFSFDPCTCSFSDSKMYIEHSGALRFMLNKETPKTISAQMLNDDNFRGQDVMKMDIPEVDENGDVTILLSPMNGACFHAAITSNGKKLDDIEKPCRLTFKNQDEMFLTIGLKELDRPQRVILIYRKG